MRLWRSDESSITIANAGLSYGSSSMSADHLIVVKIERPQRSGDGRQLGPGEPLILVAVELIEERVGAADRLPADLEPKRAQDRSQSLGQLVDRNLAVLGLDIELRQRGDLGSRRPPAARGRREWPDRPPWS